MKVRMMSVTKIKESSFNPSARATASSVKGLRENIEEFGILQPLSLTKGNKLADGHRRLAAAKIIGLKTVPVIVHSESCPKKLFASLNANSKTVTGANWLEAYLGGLDLDTPGFPQYVAYNIQRLEEIGGKKLLNRIVAKCSSPTIITRITRVARYIGWENDEHYLKVANWFLKHGCVRDSVRAVETGWSPIRLKRAINSDRPIKSSWQVG